MQFTLGLQGLGLLLVISVAFGVGAQLLLGGRAHSRWLWVIGAVGWLVGGLFASEVLWGSMTEEEIQPIIDGLAFDESLLGGLIAGLGSVLIALLASAELRIHRPLTR